MRSLLVIAPKYKIELRMVTVEIDMNMKPLETSVDYAAALKEIEGLSYEEMAEALRASVGTVKSRISRAREELKRLLQKKV